MAQTDSLPKKENRNINRSFLEESNDSAKMYSPQKAAAWAAIPVLGLGQIYNQKYWKLPIVYGVNGFITYKIIQLNKEYTKQRNELYRRDISAAYPEVKWAYTDADLAKYQTEALRTTKDLLRKRRDRFIMLAGGMYALTIVDAYVDAHLANFTIDKKRMVYFRPSIIPSYQSAAIGFNLKCSF
jgi:hypothetical protein